MLKKCWWCAAALSAAAAAIENEKVYPPISGFNYQPLLYCTNCTNFAHDFSLYFQDLRPNWIQISFINKSEKSNIIN